MLLEWDKRRVVFFPNVSHRTMGGLFTTGEAGATTIHLLATVGPTGFDCISAIGTGELHMNRPTRKPRINPRMASMYITSRNIFPVIVIFYQTSLGTCKLHRTHLRIRLSIASRI